jgi:hypothetical protein
MRRLSALALVLMAACGGGADVVSPPTKPKPDPYVTVRVQYLMDTTTATGRAHWHMYALLTGPYTNLNGIYPEGNIGLNDVESEHTVRCMRVSADSVGQRFMSPIAFADTTTDQLTPDATAAAIANDWYNGNHVLPAGWKVLFVPPTDAWQSSQYDAGHGLVQSDPIKWDWIWTDAGATSFAERTDADPACSTF